MQPRVVGVLLYGLVVWGASAWAQSGQLEPPSSAVDGGTGSPASTTQSQPSWDQLLPAHERFQLVMGGTGGAGSRNRVGVGADPHQ